MKIIVSIISFILVSSNIFGKIVRVDLAVSNIPERLKNNAHAVLRYDSTEVMIESLEKVKYRSTYAITVLNEQGKHYAYLMESYNLLQKINNIEGRLFDSSGIQIKLLKNDNIADRSIYGTSFIYHSDSRTKSFTFNHIKYPYTVVYEIEKTLKTTFFLPNWHPQPSNFCAVVKAVFSISYQAANEIRFNEVLMPPNVIRKDTTADGVRRKTWSLYDIPAYKTQPYSQNENYNSPTLNIAADQFQLLSYKGTMNTWKSLGQFNYELNNNRDDLPYDKKEIVKSLTADLHDDYSKIQKLYAYMQENTRYVANEYGIAGWQTFDANSVATNGYGDCKGLTNYMKALLKEVGIKSYVALVSAGDNYYKLDEHFPSNNFNHVILCVPQPKDSIWIECTSGSLPAGYLGSFTQGRTVLLTTEDGGYLCKTPAYGKEHNTVIRKTIIDFEQNADRQKIKLENIYIGLPQDEIKSFLKNNSKEKLQEMVSKKFPFPSYSTQSFDYAHSNEKGIPIITEYAEVMASGIIDGMQKRTFVNLGWATNPMAQIIQIEPRTAPLVLKESFIVCDSIYINLPEGFQLESYPKPTSITNSFAQYSTNFSITNNKVCLARRYEQNSGVYDAAEFEQYQKMYQTISASKESSNIVLLNK